MKQSYVSVSYTHLDVYKRQIIGLASCGMEDDNSGSRQMGVLEVGIAVKQPASESGFDIPYYAGSAQATIPKGKEVTANIICTLANVKVTVNFDATFVQALSLIHI